MALEFNDGRVTGSSGIAKAGLVTGIIGTALAATNGGNGILGGLFGGKQETGELYQLRAEKYTDSKIAEVKDQLYAAVIDLDKRTALNEQAERLNREYDNTVRDYMMTIVNNKIDCCCDKMNITNAYERELSELADASILSYVNSTFIPGKLSLPASSITPAVVLK